MESLRAIECGIVGDCTKGIFFLQSTNHECDLLRRFILDHAVGLVDLVCGFRIQTSNKESYMMRLMHDTSSPLILI